MDKFQENFNQKYYPYLQQRSNTFKVMFEYLDSLSKDKYLIVETGTTRTVNNFGDGNSTIMFDEYCQITTGTTHTVDLSPEACKVARENTSNNTIVVLNDSVKFLHEFPNPEDIDLLYLVSYDLAWNNPHPSAMHHIKELTAIYSKLNPNCLIVVDDNANGKGKGQYVAEFLNEVGAELLFDEYQIGYRKQRYEN